MSITSARNFIEKSGCGLVVGVGLALVIVFGLFSGSLCKSDGQQERVNEKPVPIATLSGEIVSLQAIEARYRQGAAVLLTLEGGASPELEAQVYGEALERELRETAQRAIAKRRGVQITKQRIIDEAGKQFDSQMAMQRAYLMQSGQLKAGATETEVQAEMSKLLGRDVAQARQDQIKQVEQALEDPIKRTQLESSVMGGAVIEAVAGGLSMTDDQLKKDLQIVVTKRMVFYPSKHKGEDLFEKAEKVLAEIKGGLTFEAAMNKYSDDPAMVGKPKSDSTVNLNRGQISYDENLAPLSKLQPGQVTPVFALGTGEVGLYKVIRIDYKLPPNFEASKADLKKTRLREMAIQQIRAEIETMLKSDALKWDSPGFKVLYDWFRIGQTEDLRRNETKRLAEFTKVAETAKKIMEDPDPIGSRSAALTWFVALDAVFDKAAADRKKAMAEEWISAANAVLESIENVDLRIDLAKEHLALKHPADALTSLVTASESNAGSSAEALKRYQTIESLRRQLEATASKEDLEKLKAPQDQWKTEAFEALKGDAELNEDYTEEGRKKYADTNRKITQYRSLGIISAAQATEVEVFQKRWVTEKAKADNEAAAQKKKDEAAAKKAIEDAKKQAKPTTPGTSPPQTPSSTDLGKAGTGSKTGG